MLRRECPGDRLDVDGERHDHVLGSLVWQLDALVAQRVRVDAEMIADHRERLL